ncbi:hypothetical protein [Geopseudomonas aromaticivorans]
MSRSYLFVDLHVLEQEHARANFSGACPGDGFRYELDADGHVRSRFTPPRPVGQPEPIYADGYPVRQSTD